MSTNFSSYYCSAERVKREQKKNLCIMGHINLMFSPYLGSLCVFILINNKIGLLQV